MYCRNTHQVSGYKFGHQYLYWLSCSSNLNINIVECVIYSTDKLYVFWINLNVSNYGVAFSTMLWTFLFKVVQCIQSCAVQRLPTSQNMNCDNFYLSHIWGLWNYWCQRHGQLRLFIFFLCNTMETCWVKFCVPFVVSTLLLAVML